MISVFFSYSHRDETLRDELEIHLSSLKRQGVIGTWHDRRIGAGHEVDSEISEHLEMADIILLLVSPYFIASDYCYDIEMKRAMERHERGEALVIPIILHPCDWQAAPFGKLMAVPADGKPISKFPNQHDAFLEVTKAVREAAESMRLRSNSRPSGETLSEASDRNATIVPDIRSSNLRIKKEFTDIEKDRFLSEAFEYIAKFFEGSLSELKARNTEVDTDFRRVDANHFAAAIYVNGIVANRCRIWLGGRDLFSPGIAYSVGDSGDDNSFNESLSVEDDGHSLFLRPLGMASRMHDREEQMTYEGGAEYFWGMFIEPLQR
ncbi:MAG: TIR domain-containing protein [Deltaproteobacteria bacterium]|nr:TIR domain-containing protein [Deltaproteobacteria bacterium]